MRVCVHTCTNTRRAATPTVRAATISSGNHKRLSVCRSARRSTCVLVCMYACLPACLNYQAGCSGAFVGPPSAAPDAHSPRFTTAPPAYPHPPPTLAAVPALPPPSLLPTPRPLPTLHTHPARRPAPPPGPRPPPAAPPPRATMPAPQSEPGRGPQTLAPDVKHDGKHTCAQIHKFTSE